MIHLYYITKVLDWHKEFKKPDEFTIGCDSEVKNESKTDRHIWKIGSQTGKHSPTIIKHNFLVWFLSPSVLLKRRKTKKGSVNFLV